MNIFQPWDDAISLMSGRQPPRSPRPGESVTVREAVRKERLHDHVLTAGLVRLLAALRSL